PSRLLRTQVERLVPRCSIVVCVFSVTNNALHLYSLGPSVAAASRCSLTSSFLKASEPMRDTARS
ncbi:MAG: hypothetical protein ABIV50_13500, partial [Opitutus sp.]